MTEKLTWHILLDRRRPYPWVIGFIVLYTLAGFLLAPMIIKDQMIKQTAASVNGALSVSEVRLNPYVLDLRLTGIALNDADGVLLVAADEFYINFQLSSIFNLAWTFAEIKLSAPYVLFERFTPEDNRFTRLLPPAEPVAPVAEEEESELPSFILQRFEIAAGHLDTKDQVPSEPVEASFTPINIVVADLNNIPDRAGSQDVVITMPYGGTIGWSGELALFPLRSSGQLSLSDLNPRVALS